MKQRQSIIIIPSLDPDESLINFVDNLKKEGFLKIILVNDGSHPSKSQIFSSLRDNASCDLLIHAKNMGKGRALKNAFNHYLVHYAQNHNGVITVDADGQHSIEDIIKVDDVLSQDPSSLILGCRDFDNDSVPWKSSFGNKLTRIIMKYLIGLSVTDTQTGLRGIPNSLLANYLDLFGERFEYETSMLIDATQRHTSIQEITIQTIYLDDNRATHFHPLLDSVRIYRLLFSMFLRYTAASLSSFVLDYGLFCLMIFLLSRQSATIRIWTATVIARLISSFYNFLVNKTAVFRSKANLFRTMLRYYILCAGIMISSASLVSVLYDLTNWKEAFIKLIIDTLLFFVSYKLQQNWIFLPK